MAKVLYTHEPEYKQKFPSGNNHVLPKREFQKPKSITPKKIVNNTSVTDLGRKIFPTRKPANPAPSTPRAKQIFSVLRPPTGSELPRITRQV